MPFVFSSISLANLQGVHPDLAKVMHRAIEITPVDFRIIEGLRRAAREDEMVKQGASQTKHSRHLTGHAVDIAAYVGGHIDWTYALYERIAPAVKQAAHDVGVPIEWGGDWKTLKDGGHYQLPWAQYPIGK